MQVPLQISFHNMDPSPAVEAIIREKAAKLDRYFGRIVSCDVSVEAPHRHHHKGKLYKVRIDIGLPDKDVHVNQEGPQDHAHKDVNVAVRDAFDAAVRQLEDHARRMRVTLNPIRLRMRTRRLASGFDADPHPTYDPAQRALAGSPLSVQGRGGLINALSFMEHS